MLGFVGSRVWIVGVGFAVLWWHVGGVRAFVPGHHVLCGVV